MEQRLNRRYSYNVSSLKLSGRSKAKNNERLKKNGNMLSGRKRRKQNTGGGNIKTGQNSITKVLPKELSYIEGRKPVVEDRGRSIWIYCPICHSKTRTKIYKETVLLNFPLYCPKCRKEIQVNVVKLKMVLSNEPDA